MYLGSVKFFKHLIVGFVLLIITALVISVIALASANKDKDREIEQLRADLSNLLDNRDPDDIGNSGTDDDDGHDYIDAQATTTPPQGTTPPPRTEPPEPDIPPSELSALSELYPEFYSAFSPPSQYMDDEGYVYITFNGSPSEHTEEILTFLERQEVNATFFVVPEDTESGADYLNRILDAGHEIGLLGMSNNPETVYESAEVFLEDFDEAFALVFEQTKYKPYLFRFPGDSVNDYNADIRNILIAEMTRRGFIYYDWNVNSRDALGHNYAQMWSSILSDVDKEYRSVILFHDRQGGFNTTQVLEQVIIDLKARGYTLSHITPETKPMQL